MLPNTARWQRASPIQRSPKCTPTSQGWSKLTSRFGRSDCARPERRLENVGRPGVAALVAWIARRLGPDAVLSTVAAKEAADRNVYVKQPETAGTRMSAQEQWHTRVLGQLLRTQPQGLSGSFLGRLEGRHRAVGGNALRAAVLGANDGLCSNLSLVMGVAGAAINRHGILITCLAGLVAGACSMRWENGFR